MATPTYQTPARGNTGGNVTSWSFTYPALAANDILILAVGSDGNPTFSALPAGWTIIKDEAGNGSACRAMVAWKRATGAETGTFTGTSSASEGGGWQILVIRGASTTDAPAISTGISAATANPDPDALDPAGWGTERALWIAVAVNDGNVAITAGPAGYANFINDRWANTAGAGVATATIGNVVASENPGVFTMGAEDSRAFTIGIRPAPVDVASTTDAIGELAGALGVSPGYAGAVEGVAEHPGAVAVARALASRDPFPPLDISDAGSTATPPTDISDAGSTATPPSDISDAAYVDPDGIVAEHVGDLTVTAITAGPSRHFDGIDDVITTAAGSLAAVGSTLGAMSVAVLWRPHAVAAMGLIKAENSSAGQVAGINPFSDGLVWFTVGNFQSTWGYATGEWYLMVWTKVAGSLGTARHHRYTYSAPGTGWEHTTFGSGIDNSTAGPIDHVLFGKFSGTEWLNGDIAAAAWWNGTVLSDANVDTMESALQAWADLSPTALWRLNQASAGTAVADLTGGGANQTAITGTTVHATEGPPGFDFTVATVVQFAGACEAVAEHVALLDRARPLDGASEAVAEHVALLDRARPFDGASEGVAQFVALLDRAGDLTGAGEAVAEHVGIVSMAKAVAGASEAVAEHVALLDRARPLDGASEAVAEHVADLTVTGPGGVARDFAGACEAVAELAGVLALSKAVSGASEGVAELAGVLDRDRGLVGASEAVAEHVALLARDRGIVGAVEGVAEHVAIAGMGKAMVGASEAVAQHVADIGIAGQVVYIGASEAVAEHVASLGVARPIVGASEAVAELVAVPTRDRALAGAVEGVAENAGVLSYGRGFAGAHEAVAELAGVLGRGVGFAGAAELVAEASGEFVAIPLGFYEPSLLRLTGADDPSALDAVDDRRVLVAITDTYTLTAIRED